jgi:hypothetical protein
VLDCADVALAVAAIESVRRKATHSVVRERIS